MVWYSVNAASLTSNKTERIQVSTNVYEGCYWLAIISNVIDISFSFNSISLRDCSYRFDFERRNTRLKLVCNKMACFVLSDM